MEKWKTEQFLMVEEKAAGLMLDCAATKQAVWGVSTLISYAYFVTLVLFVEHFHDLRLLGSVFCQRLYITPLEVPYMIWGGKILSKIDSYAKYNSLQWYLWSHVIYLFIIFLIGSIFNGSKIKREKWQNSETSLSSALVLVTQVCSPEASSVTSSFESW